MSSLPLFIQQSIDEFIEPYKQDENTLAIILAGSYAYGQPSKNFDVDIHIILKEGNERERGNTWLNEIEYFKNTIAQINEYLREDKLSIHPTTAHMLYHGRILYQNPNDRELNEILLTARKIITRPYRELQAFETEQFKYSIDDIRKDLEDARVEDNLITYHLHANEAVSAFLEIIVRIHKVHQDKPKMLEKQLSTMDGVFFEKYLRVFQSNYDFEALQDLIKYVEEKLGGRRLKKWSLKSRLTV